MATSNPVKNDSKFCRDCGGEMKNAGNLSWCENITPKIKCSPLGRNSRNYCEFCGAQSVSSSVCLNCLYVAYNP